MRAGVRAMAPMMVAYVRFGLLIDADVSATGARMR